MIIGDRLDPKRAEELRKLKEEAEVVEHPFIFRLLLTILVLMIIAFLFL